MRRNDILLEHELAAIGHEVEHTEPLEKSPEKRNPRDPWNDGAIRTGPALDPGRDLALGHGTCPRERNDHGNGHASLDCDLEPKREIEE
jgi:hypothetical protein